MPNECSDTPKEESEDETLWPCNWLLYFYVHPTNVDFVERRDGGCLFRRSALPAVERADINLNLISYNILGY